MAAKPSNELVDAGQDADCTMAMKNLAIEEGDGGNSDSSSDDSIVSVGDMGSDSEWLACNYFPEKEPEWDVDSFDGQELKIHPLVRKTYPTQELYDQYYEKRLKAFESKVIKLKPLSRSLVTAISF